MAVDFVCQAVVQEEEAEIERAEYQGVTYFFCGSECKKAFEADPDKYVTGAILAAHDISLFMVDM